jgi:hypothetical protein
MKSYEVLREAAEKVGVKSLAAELKLSPALIYKWCQEPGGGGDDSADGSGARNPLDRLSEIVRLTRHVPVVNWLCHEADGFFVHNPPAAPRDLDHDLLASTQQLVENFSRLLAEVSRSAADDHRISADEAQRIRATWERLKTHAETFVVACERGVYQPSSPKTMPR